MIVEIMIGAAELADTMKAMRNWLDIAHCTPVLFQTKSSEQPGFILIRVEFKDDTDATAFRLAFDAGAPDVPSAAA
jgi:hypothetical protein